METVEAAVRLGSFTLAASELGLTQSAVSNSIRRFEQELGQRLFIRNRLSIEATQAAIEIARTAAKAKQILQSQLEALEIKTPSNSVAIAVAPTFASRWLAPRLSDLRATVKPGRVSVSSRVQLSERADVWIRNGEAGRWRGLISRRLLGAVKAPVASHQLVGHGDISDDEVLAFPLLGVDARPMEWNQWASSAGMPDKAATPDFSFDVTSSAWDAAIAGSGVALGDLTLLKCDVEDGNLRQLGTTTLGSYAYFICRRRGDRRPDIKRVWDWFCSQCSR